VFQFLPVSSQSLFPVSVLSTALRGYKHGEGEHLLVTVVQNLLCFTQSVADVSLIMFRNLCEGSRAVGSQVG
jgi:hypothetical protein